MLTGVVSATDSAIARLRQRNRLIGSHRNERIACFTLPKWYTPERREAAAPGPRAPCRPCPNRSWLSLRLPPS